MRTAAILFAAALLPLPASAAPPATEHVVVEGETLNGIANRAGVTSNAVIGANGLKPPYVVRTGQKLRIPRRLAAEKVAGKASTPKAGPAPKAGRAPKVSTVSPTAATQETSHVVADGETLMGIANRARVPRVLIAEANGIKPPYAVRVGQELIIPRTRRYTVKPGDTGLGIATKHATSWSQIAVANSLDPDAPVVPGKTLLIPTVLAQPSTAQPAARATVSAPAPRETAPVRFSWPVKGTTKRGWKPRGTANTHDGLDIAAPKGTPVRAAAAGKVVFAGAEKEQFGNLVIVNHGDGWNTAYGFLSRITVKPGDTVAAGERVGLVGDTGKAHGEELHFEVRQDGVPIDPRPELPSP